MFISRLHPKGEVKVYVNSTNNANNIMLFGDPYHYDYKLFLAKGSFPFCRGYEAYLNTLSEKHEK